MSDDPKPTPRYMAILGRAAKLARELGHQHTGAEHLFLAIIQDPHAIPTQVLTTIADLPAIQDRLLSVMSSPSYRTGSAIFPSAGEDDTD